MTWLVNIPSIPIEAVFMQKAIVQVKGLLGRNPERARNGGAENECFEANSTG